MHLKHDHVKSHNNHFAGALYRHTDNTMERRDLVQAKKEFTTQKIRQEWAEHEEQFVGTAEGDEWPSTTCTTVAESVESNATFKPIDSVADDQATVAAATATTPPTDTTDAATAAGNKDDSKSKKKRRKKSMMKKKATQRKSSSSSSIGSAHSDQNDPETDTISMSATTNETRSSSNEDSPKSEQLPLAKEFNAAAVAATNAPLTESHSRVHPLDIHFFSDTELTSTKSPSRPSTPIQSDSEIEISHRDSNVMTSSASWKWGELPTQGVDSQEATTEDAKQAQRNSMLSNMFSFMKQTKKLRKTSNAEGVYLSELEMAGMDPEVAALYFPPINKKDTGLNGGSTTAQQMMAGGNNTEDDRESGNGTSLPHSPSSMEGLKSLDSDYDDNGKMVDNK